MFDTSCSPKKSTQNISLQKDMRAGLGAKISLLLLCLVVLAVAAIAAPASAQAASGTTVTFSVSGTRDYTEAFAVLKLVNQQRAAVSLPPLTMDTTLLEVAMNRAAETEV
ncbi:MAG: hypothetical protein FWD65_08690, partial [Coriobacteriia bacterium]|nr:hypothetical protein [Coriobacteriia bacterium]